MGWEPADKRRLISELLASQRRHYITLMREQLFGPASLMEANGFGSAAAAARLRSSNHFCHSLRVEGALALSERESQPVAAFNRHFGIIRQCRV